MLKSLTATLGLVLALAGCGAPAEDVGSTAEELAASDAIARAEDWVGVRLQYCQSANHQRDYDDACSTYCNRYDDSAWDPYRSDCSGLVSWAWGLPAPGRTTWEFAPFRDDITSVIDASSLRAADAVNNSDHIMLFKQWLVPGQRAEFIEEPGCATAITYAHQFESDVSVSGSSIYVDYVGMRFTAIRYDHFGGTSGGGGGGNGCVAGGLYCGGDKVSGDPNTLYRCSGGSSGTVVEHCADGCDVVPGQDDACGSAASGGGGGNCVVGGLYCGGDKVSGDAGTLYRCNGTGAPTVVERCSAGCQVNAGSDDACRSAGGGCTAGGLYCGGDKLSGNANTLYRCNGGAEPTVVERCSAGCQVNPGADDSCKSGGGSCVDGGLYCGGDKLSGNASTLYRCNGAGAPSVVTRCAHGCQVNDGINDSCRSGASCVVGGLYCGGDKVNGLSGTLYRCTGGSSGTVVEHCASGCEVLSGRNDACK